MTDFAPNTYTFTKLLAENVCKDFRDEQKLPITIVRPSIISCKLLNFSKFFKLLNLFQILKIKFFLATEFEPFTGHLDNLNGPFGLVIGAAIGVYQITLTSGDCKLDYVPVDILIKAMIIAGWKDWKEKSENLPIYNASGIFSPSFASMKEAEVCKILPPINAIMYNSITFTNCAFYAWIVRIVEMFIPAMILDKLLMLSGQRPR